MLSKERTLIVSVTTFEEKGIDPEDLLGFRRQSFDHGVCCGLQRWEIIKNWRVWYRSRGIDEKLREL